jgi:hypothetical protein
MKAKILSYTFDHFLEIKLSMEMLVRKMEKQYITIQVTLEMVVQGELGEWR